MENGDEGGDAGVFENGTEGDGFSEVLGERGS